MRILGLLALIFPFIELIVLIQVGGAIGIWYTLVLLVLGFLIGITLIKQAGKPFKGIRDHWQQAITSEHLLKGFLLVLSGVFFMFPGFISDFIGFTMAFPLVRNRVSGFFHHRLKLKVNETLGRQGHANGQKTPQKFTKNTIEGEFTPLKK